MSISFKLFIVVFFAIIAAKFFITAMFKFWFKSDTELTSPSSKNT